ncbi:MAG: hypothetical protein GY816_07730 [Cytophagales bacterium]|nr:hypothetical protein [Cytophagales bacterium]
MYLFFDTETTGLPRNWKAPVTDLNKWPSLSELHYKLFRRGFDEAHDAAADIQATAKCFWELRRIGVV